MRQETAPLKPPAGLRILARPAAAALYAIAILLVGFGAIRAVLRAHADRISLATGEAQWIWYSSGPAQPTPLRFYATREIVLRQAPVRATAKLFVDGEYVLYVNGAKAGAGAPRPGDPLRLYRVAALMRPGVNRIAIEASNATGVGAILFALDLDAFGRNAVVSNGLWRVDLSAGAVTAGARYRPMVWGKPPQRPWGYPRMPRPNEVVSSQSSVFGFRTEN
ncbi:MAG: hypothetical protein ABI968_10705 [Acidobacteriota bacterium]